MKGRSDQYIECVGLVHGSDGAVCMTSRAPFNILNIDVLMYRNLGVNS